MQGNTPRARVPHQGTNERRPFLARIAGVNVTRPLVEQVWASTGQIECHTRHKGICLSAKCFGPTLAVSSGILCGGQGKRRGCPRRPRIGLLEAERQGDTCVARSSHGRLRLPIGVAGECWRPLTRPGGRSEQRADLETPNLNGLDTPLAIRRSPKDNAPLVLMLTGSADECLGKNGGGTRRVRPSVKFVVIDVVLGRVEEILNRSNHRMVPRKREIRNNS